MTQRAGAIAGAVFLAVTVLGLPAFPDSGVTIKLFQFQPSPFEVRAGTKVAWTNQDDIEHTVTSGTPGSPDGQFDVTLNGKGASVSVELTKPGVYPYFCSRHQSMRGEMRVK